MMTTIFQVALGGAIGSVLRFLTVTAVGAPMATLVVNVLGSFAMGVLFVLLTARAGLSPFLMTGVLGGFTTFSAFSLDALKLWQSGQALPALAYVGASVLLSLAAVALGAALAKGIWA
ncbi:MAG: CrcB family protein [Cypionkella sp.]|nr:CrcB family protein [Cypionkella sp.]